MLVKGIIAEDFINYKKPSMVIECPTCNFKCGKNLCQNSSLTDTPNYDLMNQNIVNFYLKNDITCAIIFAGLEPFDSFNQMCLLIQQLREYTNDDIVIYTGYEPSEISEKISWLKEYYKNIIVKFGRYIPNQTSHYDPVLGVQLASDNQYAEKIS